MKRIFWGLLLVFLDIQPYVTVQSGLLPDCAGYLLALSGLRELAPRGVWFRRGRAPAALLALCAAARYAAAVFFPGAGTAVWYAAEAPLLLLHLFLLGAAAFGAAELEAGTGRALRAGRLVSAWRLTAAARLAALLSSWYVPRLAKPLALCAAALGACYLAALYAVWSAFEARPE